MFLNISSAWWIFFILGSITVIAPLGVVFAKDAIRSALCLVANFIALALIYFSLDAQMIGISQIMVYVGAIMVLFLFVVMLLTPSSSPFILLKDRKVPFAFIGALGLLAVVGSQIILPLIKIKSVPLASSTYGSPEEIGKILFTQYVFPFEMISVLLLVGLVGTILLAKRRM